MKDERRQLLQDNMQAYTNHQEKLRARSLMSTSWDARGFVVDQPRINAVVAPLRDARATAQAAVARNWVSRLSQPVIDVLPIAGLVLLASFFGHFAIKAFFYYVLAPLRPGINRSAWISGNPAGSLYATLRPGCLVQQRSGPPFRKP